MKRLDGLVAIIVGGGQTEGATIGNGRATALRFAQEGAAVAVFDRRLDSAQDTVDMIRHEGGTAEAYEVDVTSEVECKDGVERVLDQFRVIDVLHNNVGIGTDDASPHRVTRQAWDAIFETNVSSAMLMCSSVVPHMRERRTGVITNVSSLAAIAGVANLSAYKASKAALNAYTQALALSNARYGIRANVIMPGLIDTPMAIEGHVAAGADRDELISRRNAAVPLGAMGTAWDVANAALFLASSEAAFITGIALPVDGGQSAKIG